MLRNRTEQIGLPLSYFGHLGRLFRLGTFSFFAAALVLTSTFFIAAHSLGPPPLDNAKETSVVVLDKHERLLRPYATQDGRWRLPVKLEDVDPNLIAMLLAYEDKRFYRHYGVDPLALMRAVWQFVRNGKVVSGGSTLTMQVARLLDGQRKRSLKTKFKQIVRALQLEQRLSKKEILTLYLVLAPYGGNIEGVRAATLTYFGKEPKRLSPHEIALLVALPQSPETRRPDRFAKIAKRARNRVLNRAVKSHIVSKVDADRAKTKSVPKRRHPFPMFAAHLADEEIAKAPGLTQHRLTIDRKLQRGLETLTATHVRRLGPRLSGAILVVDHKLGSVLAYVASAGYLDNNRFGAVNMVNAIRSPGSALKPFVYGLAFESGLAHPETLIEDRPTRFGDYAPENFDGIYRGTVTIREALQLSLNIPAVKVLDAIGPARLSGRMRMASLNFDVPHNLTVALGGTGISLHNLTELYAALARGGAPTSLYHRALPDTELKQWSNGLERRPLLSRTAAWYVANILAGTPPPKNAKSGGISYKTGTSYGHRDAWAVGFDGRHTIAVWIGRPDNTATPGLTGQTAAAPLLFDAFAQIEQKPMPLAAPPRSVVHARTQELPPPLMYFRDDDQTSGKNGRYAPPVQIAFPPHKAQLDIEREADGTQLPVALKAEGGALPLTWLIDGAPLTSHHRRRTVFWAPDGKGFVTLTVIDAKGSVDRVTIRIR